MDVHELLELADKRTQQDNSSALQEEIEQKNQNIGDLQKELSDART